MVQSAIIGRGTKIKVALIGADRIFPEEVTLTVSTAGAVGDSTLAVAIAPATTRAIVAPFWINFIDPTGAESLVKVATDVAPGATATLAVTALKKAIPINSVAGYPVLLGRRESANLTDADEMADIKIFENDGWKDSLTTMLGNGLELPGFYSPLNAGWTSCLYARNNFRELFWALYLPKPDVGYTTGHIVKGFTGVKIPIETPADGIIKSTISFTSRSPVTFIDPA